MLSNYTTLNHCLLYIDAELDIFAIDGWFFNVFFTNDSYLDFKPKYFSDTRIKVKTFQNKDSGINSKP